MSEKRVLGGMVWLAKQLHVSVGVPHYAMGEEVVVVGLCNWLC